MNTPHTPLTLEQRIALADRLDDLIDEVDAGWSMPVMEGFFMALAMAPKPPEASVWLAEALPVQSLPEEEREALTTDVMRVHADVHDFLGNEDSEWLPLCVHTEPTDVALTALGFVQGMEHFAAKEWKRFVAGHKKSAAIIRTVAGFALDDGHVTQAQFDVAEKKFMECVFEVYGTLKEE
ncbi:MAG TPA: UPF0149 family protein [Candidatus Didemnitutus sp.]|nr:UPF0149 family protein [Candidatus Didemnitutus sp.]